MRRAVVAVLGILALALVAAGCGGGAPDAPPDLAGPAPDLLPRPTAGIACGPSTCFVDAQLCCTSDSGASGTCDFVQAGTCGHSEFFCDGPEDCPPAMAACCVLNGFAQCGSIADCGAGKRMCHKTADCATGESCCPAPGGSPYALCLQTACP